MLRDDTKVMLEKNWEPKIPALEAMRNQVRTKSGQVNGKCSGSVRMALGKFAINKNV